MATSQIVVGNHPKIEETNVKLNAYYAFFKESNIMNGHLMVVYMYAHPAGEEM